ncbi:MAG: ABC transporter ATP-binding protein, partial [Actinomycetota bacterium]
MPEHVGEPVIEVDGLVKTFGSVRALDGLDLHVERGEVHGFLGPNGAGKTVTIRILLGLLRHDAGTVRLLGGDPWLDAVTLHEKLAYVPGDVTLWPTLTGGEIIDVLGHLRGGIDRRRRRELIERFALDPRKKARSYSKGNRQKVALVAALAADTELLLLDEPTSGLDPLMEAAFQDCIAEAVAAGRTVLLSSHILAEVEKLCDRVTIIRDGRTVQRGALADLRAMSTVQVTVTTASPLTGLDTCRGVHAVDHLDGAMRFDVESDALDQTMRHVAGFGITSMVSQPPTLEDLFLRHYIGDLDAGVRNVGDGEPGAGEAGDVPPS